MALLLGKTVSELDMSWREFSYWQEYLRIEHPERGANKRAASIMAQITNMSGRSLPDKKTVTAEDFLGEKKPQSMEAQIAFMKGLGKSNGS